MIIMKINLQVAEADYVLTDHQEGLKIMLFYYGKKKYHWQLKLVP